MEGRAQGLLDYCRYDNAFATGLRGQRYQGVCPPEMDAAFDRYNGAAFEIYRLRQELDSVDSQLSSLEYQLGDRKQSDEDRRSIRSEIRDLDRRRDRLRDDLYFSERQLDRLEEEARYLSRP
jgi:predicted  nucleic acid-binding Zn-ribbon protein